MWRVQIRLNNINKDWIVRVAKTYGVRPTLAANFFLWRHYIDAGKKVGIDLDARRQERRIAELKKETK